MRSFAFSATAIVLAASTVLAQASTINFTLDSGSDKITFSLAEPAVSPFPNDFNVRFFPSIWLNGMATRNGAIYFLPPDRCNPCNPTFPTFHVQFVYQNDLYAYDENGSQVFSGSTRAPIFAEGTQVFPLGYHSIFSAAGQPLHSETLSGDTLTIAHVTTSPVPEPSTVYLLSTGIIGVMGACRRRLH